MFINNDNLIYLPLLNSIWFLLEFYISQSSIDMCQINGIIESIVRLLSITFKEMLVEIVQLLWQSQLLRHHFCASKVPGWKKRTACKTKLVLKDISVKLCIVSTTIFAIFEIFVDFVGIFGREFVLMSKILIGKFMSTKGFHVHHHFRLKFFVIDLFDLIIFIQPSYSDRNGFAIFIVVDSLGADIGLNVYEVYALPLLGLNLLRIQIFGSLWFDCGLERIGHLFLIIGIFEILWMSFFLMACEILCQGEGGITLIALVSAILFIVMPCADCFVSFSFYVCGMFAAVLFFCLRLRYSRHWGFSIY